MNKFNDGKRTFLSHAAKSAVALAAAWGGPTGATLAPARAAQTQAAAGNTLGIRRGINVPYVFLGQRAAYLASAVGDLLAIRAAGFDHIRLCVDPGVNDADVAFFNAGAPTTWARLLRSFVEQAIAVGLKVMLTCHTFEPVNRSFMADLARSDEALNSLADWWRQMAQLLHGLGSDQVLFELLNEPTPAISPARWNVIQRRLHSVVRAAAPDHWIVGTSSYSFVSTLSQLDVVPDAKTAYTFHFYDFNDFQLQQSGGFASSGVQYYPDSSKGRTIEAIRSVAKAAKDWADGKGVQIICNEWGVTQRAPVESLNAFLADITTVFEGAQIPWSIWNYVDLDEYQLSLFSGPVGKRQAISNSSLRALKLQDTAAGTPLPIAPVTGLWMRSDQTGRLYGVQALPSGQVILIHLATAPEDGPWAFLLGQGDDNGTYRGRLQQLRDGSALNAAKPTAAFYRDLGEAHVSFMSSQAAQTYTAASCTAIEPVLPKSGTHPLCGLWMVSGESGSFVFVDTNGSTLLAVLLMYADNGTPQWYASICQATDLQQLMFSGDTLLLGRGQDFFGAYTPWQVVNSLGKVSLTFEDRAGRGTVQLPSGRSVGVQKL